VILVMTSEIPKFDLAEQILAEQRKITAIRRKAPGKPQRLPSPAPAVTRVQAQDGAAGKKPKAPDAAAIDIVGAGANRCRDCSKGYRKIVPAGYFEPP